MLEKQTSILIKLRVSNIFISVYIKYNILENILPLQNVQAKPQLPFHRKIHNLWICILVRSFTRLLNLTRKPSNILEKDITYFLQAGSSELFGKICPKGMLLKISDVLCIYFIYIIYIPRNFSKILTYILSFLYVTSEKTLCLIYFLLFLRDDSRLMGLHMNNIKEINFWSFIRS